MPITVQHGGGNMDALATLAILMGRGQMRGPELPNLPTISSLGGSGARTGGGGGGSRGGSRGSDTKFGKRGPQKRGLSEHEQARNKMNERLKEDEFGAEQRQKERLAEAKAAAEKEKLVYSAKDEAQKSQINAALSKNEHDNTKTPEERDRIDRALKAKLYEVSPTITSKAHQYQDIQGPDGKMYPTGPGFLFPGPDGGMYSTIEDANGKVDVKRHFGFSDSREAADRKEETARLKENEATTRLIEAQADANRQAVQLARVKQYQTLREQTVKKTEIVNGVATVTENSLSEDQVKQGMKEWDALMGIGPKGGPTAAEAMFEQLGGTVEQPAPAPDRLKDYNPSLKERQATEKAVKAKGLPWDEEKDGDLPEDLATAQATLRKYKHKYRWSTGMPPHIQREVDAATRLLEEAKAGRY